MKTLERSIEFGVPADDVFDFLSDASRNPEWIGNLNEVTDIRGEGAALEYDWVFEMAGVELTGTSAVTEFVQNEKLVRETEGKIHSTWTHTLEPTAEGCELTLQIEYEIPTAVIGKIAEAVLYKKHEKDLEEALSTLKGLVEEEYSDSVAAE